MANDAANSGAILALLSTQNQKKNDQKDATNRDHPETRQKESKRKSYKRTVTTDYFIPTYAGPMNPENVYQLKPEQTHSFYMVDPSDVLEEIRKKCGPIQPSRVWREGEKLVINTPSTEFKEKLTKISEISNVKISPTETVPHKDLNSFCGVISAPKLQDIPIEKVKRGFQIALPEQKIKDVIRLGRSTRYLLTFDCGSLPSESWYGYEPFKVVPYKRLPRRCKRCHNYGHTKCRLAEGIVICHNCGLEKDQHEAVIPSQQTTSIQMGENCKNTPRCIACKQVGHNVKSSMCPRFTIEKEIIRMVDSEKISPTLARVRCNIQNSAGIASYSQVARQTQPSQTRLPQENLSRDPFKWQQTKPTGLNITDKKTPTSTEIYNK
jgi:hypothetical protein